MDRMRQFDEASNEIDKGLYTGQYAQENCIEWIRGSKTAVVTFPKSRYASKIRKLAEKYPEEVHICHENKDGSIVAHVPVKYVKISRVAGRALTEEQKEQLSERGKEALRKLREATCR